MTASAKRRQSVYVAKRRYWRPGQRSRYRRAEGAVTLAETPGLEYRLQARGHGYSAIPVDRILAVQGGSFRAGITRTLHRSKEYRVQSYAQYVADEATDGCLLC